MTRRLILLLTLVGTLAASQPAPAGSAFGCVNINQNRTVPSLEGKDGVFFRITSDLRLHQPFSDQSVAQLARLNRALKRRGTTLIYAALPTRGQALEKALPEIAADYGYDPAIARLLYQDMIRRLQAQSILAPNLLKVLQVTPGDALPFFKTDFHWTAEGARRSAQAISKVIRAQHSYSTLSTSDYETLETGVQTGFSGMRRALQRQCRDSLPPVTTQVYQTRKINSGSPGSLDIFGTDKTPDIVLVGTSFSDTPLANFAGFVSQFTGLEVENHAITGGNQFGAITSYLTSRAYLDNPPRFLIWENPVYNNLAQFGPSVMAELIASAGTGCTLKLAVRPTADGGVETVAPLPELHSGDVILADFGRVGPRLARYTFATTSGLRQQAQIKRGDRLSATGRFFQSLAPFAPVQISQISVRFDLKAGAGATLTLCSNSKEGAS